MHRSLKGRLLLSLSAGLILTLAVAFFGLTAELLLIGFVTNSLFPWANPTIVAALILAAVSLVNILGTDFFAKLQNVLAFSMAAVMALVGLGALLGLGNDVPEGVQSFANFTSLTANGLTFSGATTLDFSSAPVATTTTSVCKNSRAFIAR